MNSNRQQAYSYLRFSTPDQMQGDSFRRQVEAAQTYAEQHGLDLDTELTFRDLGVSAYKGANAVDGALGQFIEAVDKGLIRPGSYLLVENLDRLSRDRIMTALNRFSALLEKGITVVTLADGKAYDADSLNNLPDLMLSLLVMSRAHEESDMKSRRVRAAWQAKRENGHERKLSSRCPAWLRLRNGEFEIMEDRAAIVRRIFAMALDGRGKAAIAYKLNEEGIEPFGDGENGARKADGWHPSYIKKILSNEATFGRFQPMRRIAPGIKKREPAGPPIEGYFPAIIDPADFYRVRRAPSGISGRKGRALANILSGLATCQKCGGQMHWVNKGAPPKGGSYLVCDNARRKKTCDAKSVRYAVALQSILNSLEDGEIDIRALLGHGHKDRRQELTHRLDALDGRIIEAQEGIENLLDVLTRQPSGAIEKRLAEQEATLAQLREDRAALEGEIHAASNDGDVIEDLQDAIRTLDTAEDADINARLNVTLKRIIDRIEIGISDDARQWVEKGIQWANRATDGKALPLELSEKKYRKTAAVAKVSIAVAFREPGRHLVIAADPKNKGRFIAGAVRTEGDSISDFTLKIWP